MTEVEPDPARVTLDGVLTVRTVAAVRATLLEALTQHQSVQVDCSAAESVDLSLIQLLLSAKLTAQQAGKGFSLARPAAGALLAALHQGGFLPPVGADPLWSGDA